MKLRLMSVALPALAVMLAIAFTAPTTAVAAKKCCAATKAPGNMLAIRLASYYDARPDALEHAAACGFKYVFMNIIEPDKVEEVRGKLAEHGLKVAVFRGDTDLSRPGCVDEMATQLATCQKMGVRYMFLSPKHKTVSKAVAIERLKKIGDVAKKHNVTIGLETHPDLGTNGDIHVATMKAIDHPNIRVNYDCANITYYNEGTDAVTELNKCIDYVGTFEFKDHDCKLESWCFPTLGEGKVDIPAVLKVLVDHGYRGPITLEIEGTKGVKRSAEEVKKEISDSAKYIRSLGKFD